MKRFHTALILSALVAFTPLSASAVCLMAVDCFVVLGLGAALLGGKLATEGGGFRPMRVNPTEEEMRRIVAELNNKEGEIYWIRSARYSEGGVANFHNVIDAHKNNRHAGPRGSFTVQTYLTHDPAMRTHLLRWRGAVGQALGEERIQAAYGPVPAVDAPWEVQGPFWGKLAEDAYAMWANKFHL